MKTGIFGEKTSDFDPKDPGIAQGEADKEKDQAKDVAADGKTMNKWLAENSHAEFPVDVANSGEDGRGQNPTATKPAAQATTDKGTKQTPEQTKTAEDSKGITQDQYLFNLGLTTTTAETMSGGMRLGTNFTTYMVKSGGKVFFANQFVKTVSFGKVARGLGVAGAGAGVLLDGYGVLNGTVSKGKFAGDTGMAALGLTGFGTLPAMFYFGIDAYYPGGFPAAAKHAAPLFKQMNQPSSSPVQLWGMP